ncbi:MAG: FeoB-associated Cys-rich membrane protein [Candidatus Zapsychrus exili]|nr:FeoB-associated Cys-rich membrane protein [Candidatus Zapsychrus exili]
MEIIEIIIILLIFGIAAFFMYSHLKNSFKKGGKCQDCPSDKNCNKKVE